MHVELHITSPAKWLQTPEPIEKLLILMPRWLGWLRAVGFGAFHRFTFHLQVGAGVNPDRVDVDVTEDGLDDGKRVTSWQKVHRLGVAKRMWANLSRKTSTRSSCRMAVLANQVSDARSCETVTNSIRKERGRFTTRDVQPCILNVRLQHRNRAGHQRDNSGLSPLAGQLNAWRRVLPNVLHRKIAQLLNSRPCIVQHAQEDGVTAVANTLEVRLGNASSYTSVGSIATLRKDSISIRKYERVVSGDACPSVPAIVSIGTLASSIRLAKECRNACNPLRLSRGNFIPARRRYLVTVS